MLETTPLSGFWLVSTFWNMSNPKEARLFFRVDLEERRDKHMGYLKFRSFARVSSSATRHCPGHIQTAAAHVQ